MKEAFNFGPENLITKYSNTGRIIGNLFLSLENIQETLQEKYIIISTEDIILILTDFEKFLNSNSNTNNDYTFTHKLNLFLSLFSDEYNSLNDGKINYKGKKGNILFILNGILSDRITWNNPNISIADMNRMTTTDVTSAIKHLQENIN